MTVTVTPASAAAATSGNPGSETVGMPASLSTSTSDSRASPTSSAARARSLCSCSAMSRGRFAMPSPASSRCVTRVSSDATRVACSSASRSRAEASPRLPMGVAARMIIPPVSRMGGPARRRSVLGGAASAPPRAITLGRMGAETDAADPPLDGVDADATVRPLDETQVDAGADADLDADPVADADLEPDAEPAASAHHRAEPRGTRLDRWWSALLSTPRRRALWYWGGPILVTLLAAVLRFWNLGHPQAIVFDETYYVKDAWTLLHNGYESAWPEGADADFAAGDTDLYSDDPAYVVHPPLGKWMISLGMAAFGADSAFWWRASTALGGTIAVFVLAMVARRLFASTTLAVIAGLLLAVDGNAIVMSRVALLDNWLMVFCLLGFWFVLLDRGRTARLLEARVDADLAAGREPSLGPAIWARPWVLAAGVAFGAATAVKWSGLYFIAAVGIYLVLVDALARRRAGVHFWATGAVLKQSPITFLLLVPVAAVVYLASWTGWLVTDGGYYRHWADEAGNAATGLFSLGAAPAAEPVALPRGRVRLSRRRAVAASVAVEPARVAGHAPADEHVLRRQHRRGRRMRRGPLLGVDHGDREPPRLVGGRDRVRPTSCTASRATGNGRPGRSCSASPRGTCRG